MEEDFDDTVYIMETPPGPPAGRPRWFCQELDMEATSPGFDSPEEGLDWALPRFERVMVRPLTGVYYWAGQPPSKWTEEGAGPLEPWPPSAEERREIDRNYEATVERYAEADRLAPAFAEAIVERLAPVLPDGWSLEARGSEVVLSRRGWTCFATALTAEMEDAYRGVLDGVQSEISEETTDAWPYDPKRGMHMWEPEVRVEQDVLLGWYGPEDDPVMTFPPIRLADLRAD